jgi:hypothetical protein
MRLSVTLILFVGIVLGTPSWAAEPAPAKPTATPAATPAPAPADPKLDAKAKEALATAEKADEAKQAEPKPEAKSPPDARPSPQRFIPSEQVRADFDVSFPIDI